MNTKKQKTDRRSLSKNHSKETKSLHACAWLYRKKSVLHLYDIVLQLSYSREARILQLKNKKTKLCGAEGGASYIFALTGWSVQTPEYSFEFECVRLLSFVSCAFPPPVLGEPANTVPTPDKVWVRTSMSLTPNKCPKYFIPPYGSPYEICRVSVDARPEILMNIDI